MTWKLLQFPFPEYVQMFVCFHAATSHPDLMLFGEGEATGDGTLFMSSKLRQCRTPHTHIGIDAPPNGDLNAGFIQHNINLYSYSQYSEKIGCEVLFHFLLWSRKPSRFLKK